VPDFALKEIERLQARADELESQQDTINSIAVHAQAQKIEELKARVDALETWVSVKDRMPKPGQRVIVFGKRSYQPKGFMRVTLIDGYGAWSGERYPEGHNEVTHWMNVPEPPK
jgi:hypothetical protein